MHCQLKLQGCLSLFGFFFKMEKKGFLNQGTSIGTVATSLVPDEISKLLDGQINERINELASLRTQISNEREHITAVNNYLSNVQERLNEKQAMLDSKSREMESEQHLQLLLANEESRTSQDIVREQREMEKENEKLLGLKNSVSVLLNKIHVTEHLTNWQQQTATSWLNEAVLQEDDATILNTFIHRDHVKIKELEQQLHKLLLAEGQTEKVLHRSTIDLRSVQIEVSKAAVEFKGAHEERRNIIHHWESTIHQIQKEDSEVEKQIVETLKTKDQTCNTKELHQKQQTDLKKLSNHCNQLQTSIRNAETIVYKLRKKCAESKEREDRTNTETETIKEANKSLNGALNSMQSNVKLMEKAISDKSKRYEKEQHNLEKLSTDFQQKFDVLVTNEDSASKLEHFFLLEKNELKNLLKETKDVGVLHSQETSYLQSLQQEEARFSAEVKKWKCLDQKCVKTIQQLDQKCKSQDETLAHQDEEILSAWQKYTSMENTIKSDNDLKNETQTFVDILNFKTSAYQALIVETKQQQNDIALARSSLHKISTEEKTLQEALNAVHSQIENAKQNFELMVSNKQKALVSANVVQLEIKRLQEMLLDKSANVVSLEKQQLNIENKVEERQKDIVLKQELLQTEIQLTNSLLQKLTKETNDCKSQIGQFKKRCEIMLVPLADSYPSSHIEPVHYIIKVAEDKDSLKRETNEIRNKICHAESRLKAFQNTANVLKEKNEHLERTVLSSQGSDKDELIRVKLKLSEKLQTVFNNLKSVREQARRLQDSVMRRRDNFEEIRKDQQLVDDLIAEAQDQILVLAAVSEEHKKKSSRADLQLEQLARSVNCDTAKADVTMKLLSDTNKGIMRFFEELVSHNPMLTTRVRNHFSKILASSENTMATTDQIRR